MMNSNVLIEIKGFLLYNVESVQKAALTELEGIRLLTPDQGFFS